MLLDATDESIEIELSAAVSTDFYAEYVDRSGGTLSAFNASGNTSASGPQTLVGTPGSSGVERTGREEALERRQVIHQSQPAIAKFPDHRLLAGEEMEQRIGHVTHCTYGQLALARMAAACGAEEED